MTVIVISTIFFYKWSKNIVLFIFKNLSQLNSIFSLQNVTLDRETE